MFYWETLILLCYIHIINLFPCLSIELELFVEEADKSGDSSKRGGMDSMC